MWDETEETSNGINVASGEQGFGKPRFDGVCAALFITDECVVAFGDARLIVEEEIGKSGKDILCNVYLSERLVKQFKMSLEIFVRIFVQGWVERRGYPHLQARGGEDERESGEIESSTQQLKDNYT